MIPTFLVLFLTHSKRSNYMDYNKNLGPQKGTQFSTQFEYVHCQVIQM